MAATALVLDRLLLRPSPRPQRRAAGATALFAFKATRDGMTVTELFAFEGDDQEDRVEAEIHSVRAGDDEKGQRRSFVLPDDRAGAKVRRRGAHHLRVHGLHDQGAGVGLPDSPDAVRRADNRCLRPHPRPGQVDRRVQLKGACGNQHRQAPTKPSGKRLHTEFELLA